MTETGLPATLERLTERYDPEVFELARARARIRLEGAGPTAADVVLGGHTVKLEAADGGRPDALLTADEHTWSQIADGVRGGMDAFLSRRLKIRYDLHLGVGFLAATADWGPGGLHFSHVETAEGPISINEAGAGHPVVMLHGPGATKVSRSWPRWPPWPDPFVPSPSICRASGTRSSRSAPAMTPGTSPRPSWRCSTRWSSSMPT